MRKRRALTSLIFVTLTVLGLPTHSIAQVPNSCNQPLSSPVTNFDIVDGHPATPVTTRDGCGVLISVFGGPDGDGVVVLRRTATGVERVGFARLTDRSRLMTLTPDDKTLIVGTGRNVALLDVARLMAGKTDALIGYVGDNRFGSGQNLVAVTPDGKYAFVNQASTSWISIIDLAKARISPGPGSIIGGIPVASYGGLTFSSDGRYLYAANASSEDLAVIPEATDWPLTCGDRQGSPNSPKQREGALFVIDVQRAIVSPASAIVGKVRAGCSPAFSVISPDGNTIYVNASAENAVLAFDIRSRQTPSFIGKVPVGPSPVGIRTIDNGRKIVVSNSDQYQHPNERQTLTVIDASKMAAGGRAVLGTIPTGATPRHIDVTGDGRTLLVANDGSSTLQIMDLERMALLSPRPAQQASSSTICNQPMPDPITDFKVDGIPRFALLSQDGCWIFLRVDNFTEDKTITSGVAALRRENGGVRLVRYVPVQGVHDTMAFTPDQKMLIVQADRQIALLDVAAITSGSGPPIRGYIDDIHFANKGGPQTGPLPISRDGRYLFVNQHSLAWISVIDLQKVEAGIFGVGSVAGGFPTEPFPGGIVISSDENYLFITSISVDASPACRDYDSRSVQDPLVAPVNTISVVDIRKALSSQASPVVAVVRTGCQTAPLSISPDGKTLYTTSHGDNTLRAFDVRPSLDGGKAPTLIGTVPVGSLPRDQVVVDGGKKIIVANSNQLFGAATDAETLTVIDSAKIAFGAEAVLGTIRVGADPRYLSVTPDGRTLLVSNFKSRTLQIIDLDRLPLQPLKP